MNYLTEDIKELKEIRDSVGLYSTSTIKSFLQIMIERKQKEMAVITKQDDTRAMIDYIKGGK
tara:strand:+ start:1041 stop:1226 length:186 start_codon:yes stop_codon:yes gene_type:complete